jgi:hypothetical protein
MIEISRDRVDDPRPNVLREAATPNVLRQSLPVAGAPSGPGDRRTPRRSSLPGALLLVLLLVILAIVPRILGGALTRDACSAVDDLLASAAPETSDVEPVDWMPAVVTGYRLTLDRPTSLEIVVASRRNPDESRIELVRDGFVDGFERSWESPTDHVEFGAQRFATVDGAIAFQAFGNRYACQFANEAFRGPRGSVGLHIRFAKGPPIGEQVSWVSGATQLIVFVDHPEPPPDHTRVESLVELIPIR